MVRLQVGENRREGADAERRVQRDRQMMLAVGLCREADMTAGSPGDSIAETREPTDQILTRKVARQPHRVSTSSCTA